MTTGGTRRWLACVAGGLAALAATGCGGVNRRFVIESNVPSAQVYIDNRPAGAAPAHTPFEYYGYYNVTLVHPEYRTETRRVHVVAPWYAYPPFDFLAEVVWPFRVEDVRRYYFELTPLKRTDTGELLHHADDLRQRGLTLPAPADPARPVVKPAPAARPDSPAPLPPPQNVPPPEPARPPTPPPSPFLPSVTPAGGQFPR